MDDTEHKPLDDEELIPENLVGTTVYGSDDEKIGYVSHLDGSGSSATVAVDVGGFLGLISKTVSSSMLDFTFVRDENDVIYGLTSWTKAEMQDMPQHVH